jgi:hypothetical protein
MGSDAIQVVGPGEERELAAGMGFWSRQLAQCHTVGEPVASGGRRGANLARCNSLKPAARRLPGYVVVSPRTCPTLPPTPSIMPSMANTGFEWKTIDNIVRRSTRQP